jgi:hypothetical protein
MKKAIKSKQSNIYKPIFEGVLWKKGKEDKWKLNFFSLFSGFPLFVKIRFLGI